MKTFLIAALVGLFLQFNTVFSQKVVILKPNEVYQVPPGNEEQVVINIRTFAAYHYLSAKQDTLRKELSKLDSLLSIQDSLCDSQAESYNRLLDEKQSELDVYRQSYARLKSSADDCLKEQDVLQARYFNLEQHYERTRRWRNWFIGIAACLSAGIIISVAK